MLNKEQIKWRCRRGVLELDVIFNRFLESKYDQLNDLDAQLFSELLELPDPILQKWLIYGEQSDKKFSKLINLILS
jgi:antitoxin CptB|tara:strand:+ start:592 stop:819 length:228 start_codon:yes stop_codon:yes gene_type:complete